MIWARERGSRACVFTTLRLCWTLKDLMKLFVCFLWVNQNHNVVLHFDERWIKRKWNYLHARVIQKRGHLRAKRSKLDNHCAQNIWMKHINFWVNQICLDFELKVLWMWMSLFIWEWICQRFSTTPHVSNSIGVRNTHSFLKLLNTFIFISNIKLRQIPSLHSIVSNGEYSFFYCNARIPKINGCTSAMNCLAWRSTRYTM